MIIRVRSRLGTTRVEVDSNDQISVILDKLKETWALDDGQSLTLSTTPDGNTPLGTRERVSGAGLQNGAMIHLILAKPASTDAGGPSSGASTSVRAPPSSSSTRPSSSQGSNATEKRVGADWEEPVDITLSRTDGWIKRPPSRYCSHRANAQCNKCMPVAPWFMKTLDEYKDFKYLPFHSWLKEREQSVTPPRKPLEDYDFYMKTMDSSRATLRLNTQPYRHVDIITFDSISIVNHFIQCWRDTGAQRVGFLYGTYEADKSIPLGVTAKVSAIYEPPQKFEGGESILLDDPNEDKVDDLAATVGLKKIGIIFTDLKINSKGEVKRTRGGDKHFLTANEVMRSAQYQTKYATKTAKSASGSFGSKFVTVCVTGGDDGTVETKSYQISDVCVALIRDGIIKAGKTSKKKMRVAKSEEQFIPDVFYIEKNEHNVDVMVKADPGLPIDFFLISLRDSATTEGQPIFSSSSFPIENRFQTAQDLGKYVSSQQSLETLKAVNDFHLLVYLRVNYMSKDDMTQLWSIISKRTVASQDEKAGVVKKLKKLAGSNSTSSTSTSSTSASSTARSLSAAPTSHPVASSSSSRTSAAAAKPPTVDDALLAQLVSMGFGEEQARQALWATNNQIENAINFLAS